SPARSTNRSSWTRWPWSRSEETRDAPGRPSTPAKPGLGAPLRRHLRHRAEYPLDVDPRSGASRRIAGLATAVVGGDRARGHAGGGQCGLSDPGALRARLLCDGARPAVERLRARPDCVGGTPMDPRGRDHVAAIGALQADLRRDARVGAHVAPGRGAVA